MTQVPIRRLLIVLLVCFSENLAETESPNSPNELNDHSLNNEHGDTGNDDKSNFLINEVSTEPSASSLEDNDPAESSETIVYNRFAKPLDGEESRSFEDEDPEGPTDHAIPYTEHELSEEVPTKPKYIAPGQWAKPTKSRDVSSGEVPSKLYAQVRRTHTVRRLPRKRAFENADSEEERENAARLRKVVRNSKVNTVYTEEGYEDSAYDHAGHVRDADFDEDYARKVQQEINNRKRDGGDKGKHSRKSEKNKRIDPEDFKDYDEDNGDDYETTTDHRRMDDEETRWTNSAYPKLVVESGVQKLQEDLEREVEEIEKGVEIRKLESAPSKKEGVTASPRKYDYRRNSPRNRGRNGKLQMSSSTEELEDLDEKVGEQRESQGLQENNIYGENYSTFRTPGDPELISVEYGGQETTTIANNIEVFTNGPSETYRYNVEGKSPAQSEMIDSQGVQNPTTVSYSQLFWDYFKGQQNQYTTLSPFVAESATVSPNVLLPSSGVENAFAPYSAHAELTTPFPIVDSPILNPQQFISAQTLVNPQYPEQQQLASLGALNTKERDVKWQSLNVEEPSKTETNIASDFVFEPTSNLDSKETSFDKVFSNPVTPMNRKPRYKITMRHKAMKPTESSETSSSINQDRKEGKTSGGTALNPNYVKMLMHLRNEEGAKKVYSSPPRNNLYFQSWMEGLTKMRPPVLQKEVSYQNFIPHNHHGSVKLLPLLKTSSAPLARKRTSQPSISLLPPAIADHRGRKEADYAKPKRIRNVPRQGFRPTVIEAISRSRAKRRERRSPGWESGDEAGGSTIAAKPSANNTASNRSEIERATKNSLAAVKRNPRRKVTRDVEVGLVPDTIGLAAGRPIGKKSRSSENDRGEGSRGSVVGGFSLGEGESVSCAGSMEDGEVPSELDASKNGEKVRIGGGSVKWNGCDGEKKLRMRNGWRELEVGLERISGTVGSGKKILGKVDEALNQTGGSVGYDKNILKSEEEGLNLTQASENGGDKPNLREVGEGLNLISGIVVFNKKIFMEVDEALNHASGSVGYDKKILRNVEEGLNLAQASETTRHDKASLREVGEGLNQTSRIVARDQKMLREVGEGLNQTSGIIGHDQKILREVGEGLNQTSRIVARDQKILRAVGEGLNQTSRIVARDQKILREVGEGLNQTSGIIGHDQKILRVVDEGLNQTSESGRYDQKFLREMGESLNQTSGTIGRDQNIMEKANAEWSKAGGNVGHGKPNLRGVGEGLNQTSGSGKYDQKVLRAMGESLNQTSGTIGRDQNIMEKAKADWSKASGNVGHGKNLLRDVNKGFNLTQTSESILHDQKLLNDVELKGKFMVAVEPKKPTQERDNDPNLENVGGGNDSNKIKKWYENITNHFAIEKMVSDKEKEGEKSRSMPELSITASVNEEELYRNNKKNESEKVKVLEEQKENKKTMINQVLFRPKRSHRAFDSEIDWDSNKTDETKDTYQEKSKSIHLDKVEDKKIEKDSIIEKEEQSNMKSHEDLLQESPELTDDVINKEIEARFNDNEEQKENTDENDETERVEVEIPEVSDFDYVEEITDEEDTDSVTTMESIVDKDKYPFYESEKLPTPSALRYATNPQKVPGKTYGRMNFYRSRDVYKHCDEVEPTLDVLPNEEKPTAEKGANENPQRLKGLGDKLDCFKAKYFDDDPFDNPLFLEKEVEDPLPPLDVNSKKFASRIMLFPKEDDRNVVQKSSKRPENHQNHKDQPRQRKPKSSNARPPKSRRVRIKSYSRPVGGSRPRVVRIKSSNVRYVKSRRPQKIIRRPLSSASEVSSLYMPYQNQVYEDVMGTIKNMANSYQVEEITTVPSSKEAEVTEVDVIVTNTSSNSTQAGNKEKDRKSSNSEEHSNSSDAKVEGIAPPRQFNRHRSMYKRVRVPQKGKGRLQFVQVTPNGLRPINHRQWIIRYKRGTRDHEREFFDRSAELPSVKMGDPINKTSEENVWGSDDKQERVRTLESDIIENNGTSKSFLKAAETKEKYKIPATLSSSSSDEKEESPKIIYTIKDRIRYSKPKAENSRVGKFTNKTEVVEDHRRKEPKYNYIKRRKPVSVPSTTELSLIFSTEPFLSATTHRTVEDGSQELIKENKKIQYFVNDTRSEKSNSTIGEPNPSSVELSTVSTNKTGNGYAVHENLSEEQTTTQDPAEFSRLKSFLDFVSPSYTDFSSEELNKSIFSNDTKGSNSTLNFTDSKESLENENNSPKTVHHSYFSDEESSEKAESNRNAEPSNESSEEGSASKNNDSKEGRTFFSYWNRPSSPAENYEDEKYKDLGPRLNKPAFFHPPFSFLKSRKSFFRNGSEEDSEESEEKDEYVFPWHRDKKNEKKRRKRNRFYDKSIGDYEYPWERRERLSRKSKRSDNEEDYDNAPTTKYRRNANPRGKIRFWTRRDDTSEENDSDNIESSSESRPVKKYSSNYSSKKTKLPETASLQSKKVEEISRSIKEILDEKYSDEKSKEKPGDSGEKKAGSRVVSRGIVPEDVTLAPRRSAKKEASSILVKAATKNRSSNGLLRNSLDNGESRLVAEKANQEVVNSKSETNSTLQQNKRRRRPAKSLLNVETTTKSAVNRGRRRQKMVTMPTISRAPMLRLARKKSKSVNDLKNIHFINNDTLNNADLKVLDSSAGGNRTMEQLANVSHEIDTERKIKKINKENVEAKKSTSWETKVKEINDKLNDGKNNEEKNMKVPSFESEVVDKQEDLGHHGGDDGIDESKETVTPVNDDGKFDFMDERIETLSDFAKSDDVLGDDEFGFESIVKSQGDMIPHNRAAQLSQQESREIILTKSWISQNNNF